MVNAFTSVWVPSCGDGTVARIDPKTAKVTATLTEFHIELSQQTFSAGTYTFVFDNAGVIRATDRVVIFEGTYEAD